MVDLRRTPLPEGYVRILKSEWDKLGGPSNPNLLRVQRKGRWVYARRKDG